MTKNANLAPSKKRHDRLVHQSRAAFECHEIRNRSDGHWLLQRRREDDGWTWSMAGEVISLAGGELYVGGDIDFVIFAHYSDSREHERKVRWMGEHTDLGYYVRQKAAIGSGRQLVDVYDEGVAREEVQGWLDDEREAEAGGFGSGQAAKLADVLDDAAWLGTPWDDHRELVGHLYESLGNDFMYERSDVGEVMAPRVYYAHAVLRRLCELLDAEKERAA